MLEMPCLCRYIMMGLPGYDTIVFFSGYSTDARRVVLRFETYSSWYTCEGISTRHTNGHGRCNNQDDNGSLVYMSRDYGTVSAR